jgi:hemerythrin-like domain-containing protein
MSNSRDNSRRSFIAGTAAAASAALLSGCGTNRPQSAADQPGGKKPEGDKGGAKEVMAGEDLMREHGVLRRALIVFDAAATRLRHEPASVPTSALQDNTLLFRSFGEDYHEKKLEEAFIFPVLKGKGGPAAAYPDILIAQHNRGREITDYLLAITRGAKIGANAEALATAMEGLVRMYQHHAAREDTIVFPAWKEAISDSQYDELSDKFEEIEHQEFGKDGFEDAVKKIGEIEISFGLADIAQFTAPRPPSPV